MKNTGLNTLPRVRGHMTNLTLNLVFVAIFYVFLGAAVSFTLWNIFPRFDEAWKQSSWTYKLADVSAEISIIVIVAFWLTYFVNSMIPVLHVSPMLEWYIESFGAQVVFLYAIFIFMENLDDKLIEVFEEIFGRKH
jgi:hypothetical protein